MNSNRRNAEAAEHPVYWFVLLEKAIEQSDFDTAAKAKSELQRLGVRVSYSRRREAAHAS